MRRRVFLHDIRARGAPIENAKSAQTMKVRANPAGLGRPLEEVRYETGPLPGIAAIASQFFK